MLSIQEIINQEISIYHTDNIRELLEYHNIEVFYTDNTLTENDSRMIIFQGKGNITTKSNLDPRYENFLLAHELGHYLLHYDKNINFQFLLNSYKGKLEREANEFACRFLLNDIYLTEDSNIEFIIKEKGIPLKIWYSVSDKVLPDLFKTIKTII